MKNRAKSDARWNAARRQARKSRGKKPLGPKPHEPNDQSRQLVRTLVIAGWDQEMIGGAVGCDDKTLRKHYREELDRGFALAAAMITQTFMQKCMGGIGKEARWQDASDTLIKLFMTTRLGWKEPKQEVGLTGAVGHYDLSKLSEAEIKRAVAILERAAISPPEDLES